MSGDASPYWGDCMDFAVVLATSVININVIKQANQLKRVMKMSAVTGVRPCSDCRCLMPKGFESLF